MATTAASKITNRVLVIGSGAIGLRTSLEILKRGNNSVILHGAHRPSHPSVCSSGSGGLWMPFKCNDDRMERWSNDTLDELLALSSSSKQQQPKNGDDDDSNSSPMVEIVPTIILRTQNDISNPSSISATFKYGDDDQRLSLPFYANHSKLKFQSLNVEALWWQNRHIHYMRNLPSEVDLMENGYEYAWLFHPPVVNVGRMLDVMWSEVCDHDLCEGVEVGDGSGIDGGENGRVYESMEEMVQTAHDLKCNAVVNCTGLGSNSISSDEDMVGGRGVLLHYDRKSSPRTTTTHNDDGMHNDAAVIFDEPPWGSDTYPSYIIPRGDKLVVGGSYLEGDTEEGIRIEERVRLEGNARLFGIDTKNAKPIGEWTGFRPVRKQGVRLEIDTNYGEKEGIKVIHNYGHGGSGWTVFAGCAKDVADLLS